MKIAVITPVFPPYHAGIGRVAEQEAEGLAKLGHEVTVLTPDYKRDRQSVILSEAERSEESRPFLVKRLRPFFKFGNAAWLPHLSRELKGFDVVHLHYPFIGGVSSILKSKIKNLKSKLIITYHMDLVGYGWRRLSFNLYSCLTLPKIVRAAQKIIVSSFDYASQSRLASYLEKESTKFVEVPFGVELRITNYELRIKGLKSRLSIQEGERVILFVGGLDKAHYFKGVEILLKAFKDLCYMLHVTCYMLIVGAGDLRPFYEEQAKKLGLTDKVIFTGRVSQEEMPLYYALADVFVLPSLDRSEAYGLVLLEAMAQGVPVVASDLPGVRTLVGPDRGLLVRPGDADALARALAEILQDEEKSSRMGERARDWVEKERGLDKEIAKLNEIIKFNI